MAKGRLMSFKYGFEGLWDAFHTEPNLAIQFIIGFIGLILALGFHISTIEWLFLIVVWALDFSLELTNTAIEEIVDSFIQEHHPGAKRAKDVAAAAVMVAFWTELVVGLIIFMPYIITLFIK